MIITQCDGLTVPQVPGALSLSCNEYSHAIRGSAAANSLGMLVQLGLNQAHAAMVQHVHGCGGLHLILQRGSAVAVCGVLLNQQHGRKQYAQQSVAQLGAGMGWRFALFAAVAW